MATTQEVIADQGRQLQDQENQIRQLAEENSRMLERERTLRAEIAETPRGFGGFRILGIVIFLALFAGIVVWVKWPNTKEIVAQATADKDQALQGVRSEIVKVKADLAADKTALQEAQAATDKIKAELAAEKAAKAAATETITVSTNKVAKAAATETITVSTNKVAKIAEGSGTPVAKTTEDLTLEMFKSLLWREGASKEHGHILYPETPIVGDDFGERSTHFLAPLFLKYYRLEPVLKAKSGRKAWALVPIKNSLTPPKEILGMYKPK